MSERCRIIQTEVGLANRLRAKQRRDWSAGLQQQPGVGAAHSNEPEAPLGSAWTIACLLNILDVTIVENQIAKHTLANMQVVSGPVGRISAARYSEYRNCLHANGERCPPARQR